MYNFCKLCCKYKTVDISMFNIHRYAKKTANTVNRKGKKVHKIQPVLQTNTAGKIPVIACKRKEFNFYKGQCYAKRKDIPLASQSWEHHKSKGDYFFIYPGQEINDEKKVEEGDLLTFKDFGLHTSISSTLEEVGILKPLPIQRLGIPKIMHGQNVLLSAETGCGKTLAFLLPMIDQILQWKQLIETDYNTPLGLIVTPTRELAIQIGMEAIKISKQLGIHTRILTGGQTQKIYKNPPMEEVDIIVSTLGVISKLSTNHIYNLHNVRHLVIDEVDALFHESFQDKLLYFMKRIPIAQVSRPNQDTFPTTAQLTLASATVPEITLDSVNKIIDVESVEIVSTDKLKKILVPQKFIRLGASEKPVELLKYIKPKVSRKEPVMVFSNNNSTCDWVSMFLNENNINTVNLNGAMRMMYRQGQFAKFRDGKCFVLSTTDAGSRGLDTVMTQHVLNYEFPLNTSDYIHRCGRTGRIGSKNDCRVSNFISRRSEVQIVQKIERSVRRGRPIPIVSLLNKSTEEEEEEVDQQVDNNTIDDEEVENLDDGYSIPY